MHMMGFTPLGFFETVSEGDNLVEGHMSLPTGQPAGHNCMHCHWLCKNDRSVANPQAQHAFCCNAQGAKLRCMSLTLQPEMFAVKRMVSAQPPSFTLTVLQHVMARQLRGCHRLCTLAMP